MPKKRNQAHSFKPLLTASQPHPAAQGERSSLVVTLQLCFYATVAHRIESRQTYEECKRTASKLAPRLCETWVESVAADYHSKRPASDSRDTADSGDAAARATEGCKAAIRQPWTKTSCRSGASAQLGFKTARRARCRGMAHSPLARELPQSSRRHPPWHACASAEEPY